MNKKSYNSTFKHNLKETSFKQKETKTKSNNFFHWIVINFKLSDLWRI